MTDAKKRRRPAISCVICRRRKIKCDRGLPCSNCKKAKAGSHHCVYDSDTVPPITHPTTAASSPAASHAAGETATRTTAAELQSPPLTLESPSSASTSTHQNPKWLSHRSESIPSTPQTNIINRADSTLCGVVHMHVAPAVVHSGARRTTSIMHKSRVFGQSFWFNGVTYFFETLQIIEPFLQTPDGVYIIESLMRCKALARQVKLYRTPAWPCSLTFNLPDRSLADSLLARYLATSETVYRIIHVPTFTKAYESLWHLDTVPQDSFIVQLKLIMAIGAVTLDETLSHRKEAVHWIYEAKTWLSDPRSKCKPSFQLLQINLLLLIAQGLLNTEADPSWVVMGSILRRAMHFGLHRDPDHLSPMTLFAAETRRRLWNTMLELAVQSSLQSGGAPLITLDDFDARPPSNYDDDDLLAGGTPPPHPSSRYTSSSVSIALRSTLAARLAVAHHLNDAYSSGHFQETLRIDGDLHTACRVMRRTLQGHISQGHLSASDFAVSVAEIIASRYRAALHIPFFAASMDDPTYTHSRRVVVDMSLRLWRTLYNGLASPDESAIVRWARCGSGELRQIAMQSALLIPLEVLGEMREADDVLGGPAPLREDLVAVLNQAVAWARGCIAIGETNIKGFLLSMCIEARVQGLTKPSCAEDEMPLLVLQAAKRATTEGCELLESTLGEMAAAALSEASGRCTPSVGKEDMDMPFSTDDWDMLMSEAFAQAGDADPMGWLLGSGGGLSC